MVNYTLSKFNVYRVYNSILYLWNTYSGSLVKLDEDGKEYLSSFPRDSDDNNPYFNILKKQGLIVKTDIDEVGRVVFEERKALFTTTDEQISLVIALGMNCNYHCVYCYQKDVDRTGTMDELTEAQIIEYISSNIISKQFKKLNIRWFGGEPLLYMNIIVRMSNRIIDICKSNNVHYTAGIITNGRFLNKKNVEILKNLYVETAQISLDGTEDYYCKSKVATTEDYNAVIANIIDSSSKMRISVRMNIFDNSAYEAIKVTDFLLKGHKLLGKISLYFAFVRDYSVNDSRKSYSLYVKNYLIWLEHIVHNYGFDVVDGVFPKRRVTSCGYIKSCNSCIDYLGNMYRCEHCFGDKNSIIGDVLNGHYYNKIEYLYWTTIDKRKKCMSCPYLPVCMGGCVHDYVCGLIGQECSEYKNMQFLLKLIEGGVYKSIN